MRQWILTGFLLGLAVVVVMGQVTVKPAGVSWPLSVPAGGAIRTGTTAGDTALLQAYNTTTAAYVSLATLTAGAAGTGPSLGIAGPALTAATTGPPALTISQTWNTTGVVDGLLKVVATDTASGNNSLVLSAHGGAAGATLLFSVDRDGDAKSLSTMTASAYGTINNAGYFAIYGRGSWRAPSDGVFDFKSDGNTGFTTLNLGPTTGNTTNGTLSISKVQVTCTIATDTNCGGKGTATITTTTGIPAGSLVLGVDARVTTIIAGSDGIASWELGTAADPDAWGAALALAATTTTGIANFTVTSPAYFTGATNITFTGTAGKVIDSGVIKITIYYVSLIPISA